MPDVYTFSPITVTKDFCIYEDSDQETKKLLNLIISVLTKLQLNPCRQQYG